MMKEGKPEVALSDIFSFNVYTSWRQPGFGFGQLSLSARASLGGTRAVVSGAIECMDRERVRSIMYALIDTVVDAIPNDADDHFEAEINLMELGAKR